MKFKKLSERKLQKIDRIHELLESEQYDEALALLNSFSEADRRHRDILPARLQLAFTLGMQREALELAELQCRYKPGDAHSHRCYMMALAQAELLALAYQEAQLVKSRAKSLDKNGAELIERLEEEYFRERLRLLGDDPRADALLLQHDVCRKTLLFGNIEAALPLVEKIVEEAPDFFPGRNNYAVILLTLNRAAEALEQAEYVLARQPDYSFAMDVKIRAKLALGEKADTTGITIDVKSSGLADQLSVFMRDFRFREVAEALRSVAEEQISQKFASDLAGRILHFWAFSEFSLGQRARAYQLWQEAYSCDSENPTIRGCLKEFEDQEGCVYAFSLFEIIPGGIDWLEKELKVGKENEFLKRNTNLLASLLVLGDSVCVDLAVKALGMGEVLVCEPELTSFVEGRRGSGELRLSAGHILVAKAGRTKFSMWLDGGVRELKLKQHIPRELERSPEVLQALQQTGELLHAQKFSEAEEAIRAALTKFPQEPTLWNNLGVAVSALGRSNELRKLAEEIVERFPEYPLGRINLARLTVLEGSPEEARILLLPLAERDDLHAEELNRWQDVCELITESFLNDNPKDYR